MTAKSLKKSEILFGMLFMISAPVLSAAENTNQQITLKVCADPNYMPFSHKDKSGYENQIAALIAKELNFRKKDNDTKTKVINFLSIF